MDILVLTLFPEMFAGPMSQSIMKKARDKGLIHFEAMDYRPYATSKHKNVDDIPYGGGAGMVLKPEPIFSALEDRIGDPAQFLGKIILMSPQGRPFNQEMANSLSRETRLVFVCGHYEGFDERIRALAHEEISIGDYVLTGGELPAMVVIDAVCRLLPGVLGEAGSHEADSFSDGLLEHPHYTRPRVFRGREVPEVLLSGNHERIRKWRRKEALRRTWLRRRDLLKTLPLTKEDQKFLEEIHREEEENTTGK